MEKFGPSLKVKIKAALFISHCRYLNKVVTPTRLVYSFCLRADNKSGEFTRQIQQMGL